MAVHPHPAFVMGGWDRLGLFLKNTHHTQSAYLSPSTVIGSQ